MISRRAFLRTGALGLGASAFLTGLSRLGLGTAQAAPSIDPNYKALVVVFLLGGNDSNNMVIPNDASGRYAYSKYGTVRNATTCDFSVPQTTQGEGTLPPGIPILPRNLPASSFLLHPSMTNLATLFNQATKPPLAVLCNVGTLVEPTQKNADKATDSDPDFINPLTGLEAHLPAQLMSHLDQQREWEASRADPDTTTTLTGWGGRIADTYAPGSFPLVLSDAGENLFTQGATADPVVVSPTGQFGLVDHGDNATYVQTLAAQTSSVTLGYARQQILSKALGYADMLSNAIANNGVDWGTLFDSAGDLGAQLKKIADVIAASGPNGLGLQKQIFFCSLNGFDTHAGQAVTQTALLAEVDAALFAFYTAMRSIGAGNRVVVATHSDFTRTLEPGAFSGTDHAWGGHHLILGDAVKGGKFFGKFPDLTPGGADDMAGNLLKPGGEGRWVPTTAVDQYAATLATWFDPGLVLNDLFKNLINFPTPTLTFL